MVAFVSGGSLPAALRGTSRDGFVHGCDWYHTLIKLAGGDPTDDHPGLPSTDSLDVWPYLTGNVSASPRMELLLSSEPGFGKEGKLPKTDEWNGALISGAYKLILGRQSYGFWQAPRYPNATTNHSAERPFDCGSKGCLFDVISDPSEYEDLAATMPDKLRSMMATFVARNRTRFEAERMPTDASACEAYVAQHGGFLGPYVSE